MSLAPLQKESLVDQAVRSIFGHIQKNDLKAGTVLPAEGKLAELLDVSRPVVREAMRTLVGKGVIEMVNGVGAVVRPLDARSLAEVIERLAATRVNNAWEIEEARHGLEMHAAMLAAQKRTEQDLADLEEIVQQMRGAMDDKFRYASLNSEFHRRIAQATGNPLLYTLVCALLDVLGGVMTEIYGQVIPDDHWVAIHRYHEEILAHIRNRDAAKARDATLEHLLFAVRKL